jgi:hypothetical protein
MDFFPMNEIEMCFRTLVAAVGGLLIGFERQARDKPAGLRTHLIVSASAAVLTTTSLLVGEKLNVPGEALRVAAGVVTGIGFIGAGTIVQTRRAVTGLTTAATVCARHCGRRRLLLPRVQRRGPDRTVDVAAAPCRSDGERRGHATRRRAVSAPAQQTHRDSHRSRHGEIGKMTIRDPGTRTAVLA